MWQWWSAVGVSQWLIVSGHNAEDFYRQRKLSKRRRPSTDDYDEDDDELTFLMPPIFLMLTRGIFSAKVFFIKIYRFWLPKQNGLFLKFSLITTFKVHLLTKHTADND